MFSQLSFQYPAWFLILCALLGAGYAALLYFRDETFLARPRIQRGLLALLRGLAVALISALLLSPLLKRTITQTQKPVVVLAQDQSESVAMVLQDDALARYKNDWAALREQLSTDFEVREIAFGSEPREGADFAFSDKTSNLSAALAYIYDLYGSRNLGAVVMATDGIYNEGANPAYAETPISAGVFTVALGDTTPRKDLIIKRVFHNKIAYLGDKFTIQADVSAINCAGAQAVLTVSKVEGGNARTLQTFPISVDKNDFFVTREITLEADKPGVAQYAVSLSRLSGEATYVNNARDIFVEVLDARQKVLLLAHSPHPDLSAIKQTLENNRNYQATVAYAYDPGLDPGKFDFVVLHNLPSAQHNIVGVLNTLNARRIPRLFIAGMQTDFTALNSAQPLLNIQSDGRQSDDVQGKPSAGFTGFTMSPRLIEELPRFNPVVSPFGRLNARPQAQIVLVKRIGKIDTDQPLLLVGETNGVKTGVFVGEGLWKWRLFDYMQHQNHDLFGEIFGKTVQYLAVKDDKRKFRVSLDRSIFNENEPVTFTAELYNDSYELVNDPDVSMSIRNAEGKEFAYTFNKTGSAYSLNAGVLPVGNYSYRASMTYGGQPQAFEGRFTVRAIELELFDRTANHALLRQLSAKYGGELIYPDALLSLVEKIKSAKSAKPVIYETKQTTPLLNLKWIFALLALMLGLEWFLRRYWGAY
ncbi:MAG: hypothetical protein ACK4NS_07815 [Saprospiraceae bacterium]